MLSINHLLLVLNCIMNFVVYCCFNSGFKKVVCGRYVRVMSSKGKVEKSSNWVLSLVNFVLRD